MKIHAPENPFQRLMTDRASAEGAAPPGGAFGEVLKQTLTQAAEAAAGAAAPARVQAAAAEHPAIGRLEEFLDLLDGYRQKLGDPRVTLKGLDQLVRQMQAQAERLAPLGAGLPQGDGLRDVIQRTLVAASVEILRFRRGDYLPA